MHHDVTISAYVHYSEIVPILYAYRYSAVLCFSFCSYISKGHPGVRQYISYVFLNCCFQNLTNIELFLVSKEVEESLGRGETMKCLNWCHDNKSRLRRMKVCVCKH